MVCTTGATSGVASFATCWKVSGLRKRATDSPDTAWRQVSRPHHRRHRLAATAEDDVIDALNDVRP